MGYGGVREFKWNNHCPGAADRPDGNCSIDPSRMTGQAGTHPQVLLRSTKRSSRVTALAGGDFASRFASSVDVAQEGNQSAQDAIGVHIMVAECTQYAANPHLELVTLRLPAQSTRESLLPGKNLDLSRLVGFQPQLKFEASIEQLVIHNAAVDLHR